MSSGISSKPDQAGHGAPFCSFTTVFNNYFLPNELPDKMDTSSKDQDACSLKAGDVLLTRTSETLDELGMSSVALKDYPCATFSGFLKRLRPKQSNAVYPKYFAFYLRSLTFRQAMNNNAVMTLRCSLNEQIFSYLEVLLPEIEQQKKVGDFLFQIYAKIELNNKINSQLEGMAKLLYDYWFVQFDFPMSASQAADLGKPQLSGKPYRASGGRMVYNEFLKRNVPEGWNLYKLGDIVESISTGLNPRKHFKLGSGSNFYVTIKSIEHGKLLLDSKCDRIDDSALSRINQRSDLRPGDILFTSIEPVGRLYLIQETPKNWNINESLFSIRPNRERVNSSYLYYLLSSLDCKGYCKKVSTGSIHQGIRIAALRDYTFALPEKQLLEAYSKICEPLLKQVHTLNKQNEELTQLRDWLLPMLMNGQVSVA
jgi:type I restriction enzyme S subunit